MRRGKPSLPGDTFVDNAARAIRVHLATWRDSWVTRRQLLVAMAGEVAGENPPKMTQSDELVMQQFALGP